MKKTQTQTSLDIKDLGLSTEVSEALENYNFAVNNALAAVQKLEAIAITARLSQMFGVKEKKAAKMIQKDYLIYA